MRDDVIMIVAFRPQQRLEEAIRVRNVRVVESLITSKDIEADALLPGGGHGSDPATAAAAAGMVGEHTGFDNEPTLLHWYATDAQLARCLLSCGAAVDALGVALSTPLHKAAERGATELVEVLLQYRADINVKY